MKLNNKKSVILVCSLLIVIIIVFIVLTIVSINNENKRKEAQIEPLLTAIEDCIITTQECFIEVNADEDAMNNLNTYIDNINSMEDPSKKGYITLTMVNYASEYINFANIAQKQKGTETAGVQSYDLTAAKMTKVISNLKTAQNNLKTQ